jgi:hypothetical protein
VQIALKPASKALGLHGVDASARAATLNNIVCRPYD